MKKLVALAVAGAFVVPAYADISIDGNMELSYVDTQSTAASSTSVAEDGNIRFTAKGQTANGIGVSAIINLESDGTRNGSGNQGLVLSGAFGTVALGDTDGVLDAMDKGDFSEVAGGGLGARTSASVSWALPKLVDGLSVRLSYGPENGTTDEGAGSGGAEVEGISAVYKAGAFSVGLASESNGAVDSTMYQVTGSVGGLSGVYETVAAKTAGVTTNHTQMSVMYTMGDLSVGYGNNSSKVKGAAAATADVTFVGVYYSMGGGVKAFVETASDDQGTQSETTAVGIKYSF